MSKPIFSSIFFAFLDGAVRPLVNTYHAVVSVHHAVVSVPTDHSHAVISVPLAVVSIPHAVVSVPTDHPYKKIIAPISLIAVLLISASVHAQTPVQLAPPLLKYQSVFFKNTATAELKFAMQGTSIHYTLNNQTPTKKSPVYHQPIPIKQSFTTLQAMVFGDGFLPSEIVTATFIKDGLTIKSVQQTAANEKYRCNGSSTLIDNAGGLTALNGNTWLGYQTDSVQVDLELQSKHPLSSVLINCLQDQGSWIFLPQQIQVYCFNDHSHLYELAAEKKYTAIVEIKGATCVPILIPLSTKRAVQKIKIILKGIQSLPEWHAGKGQPGWLFIDEIKVY